MLNFSFQHQERKLFLEILILNLELRGLFYDVDND